VHKWEDSIKTDVTNIVCKDANWIELAQIGPNSVSLR
jgi:hypothetical protein